MTDLVEVITAYDALLIRAKAIVLESRARVWGDNLETKIMRLFIDGEWVTLYWFHDEGYDERYEDSRRFEARLLKLSDDEFNAWCREEKARKKVEEIEVRRAEAKRRREEDLKRLAQLKAQYESE